MSQRAQHPIQLLSCLALLLGAAVAAPASGQGWSVDVLQASAVDANTTGAVVPAEDLPAADGQPQNLGLYPMAGTPAPPVGSMAQRYVFVRNGQTLAEWRAEARGRIALVKLAGPTLPATPFALIANNAAAAGAVAVGISVVVAGGGSPLSVRLLDPLGGLLASGGALLGGSALSGLDAKPALPGVYTVQVIDTSGGAGAVEISVARAERRP